MNKRAPGPWAWRKFGSIWCLVADHGARRIVLDAEVKGKNEIPILQTRDFTDGSAMVELTPEHPNARLIAAAPDLLEAVEHLLRDEDAYLYEEDRTASIERAKKALVKARGTAASKAEGKDT